MKEKKQGHAVLKDMTAPTFDRFLEWATKGFYTPPSPAVDSQKEDESTCPGPSQETDAKGAATEEEDSDEESKDTDEDVEDSNSSSEEGASSSEEETASTSTLTTREVFYTRKPVVRRSAIKISPPRRNRTVTENYTNVFLCHAQLYVFADAQDIQPLKLLALDELYAVLGVFELYPGRIGDIVQLLRYVYANTVSPSQGTEPLRQMISNYVAFETDTLNKDGRFAASMIEDGGDMLRDYMSCVSKNV